MSIANLSIEEAFTAGEKHAPLAYTFQDANGVALTGILGTVVAKFQWRRRGDANPATVANATFDVSTAVATYDWTGAEMATAGNYDAELWIGNGSNRYASVRITYFVRAPVGVAPAI